MPSTAKSMFLIRDHNGQMRTVISPTARGALRTYAARFKPQRGSTIEIKQRGINGWKAYKVS